VFFDNAPFGAKISIRAEQDLVSGTTGPVQSAEGGVAGVVVKPAERVLRGLLNPRVSPQGACHVTVNAYQLFAVPRYRQ
jgi:hypothetical protein